jgi:hypothetical protein
MKAGPATLASALLLALAALAEAQILIAPEAETKSPLEASSAKREPAPSLSTINNQAATFYPASLAAIEAAAGKEEKASVQEPAAPAATPHPLLSPEDAAATENPKKAVGESFQTPELETPFVEPQGLSKKPGGEKAAPTE